MTSLMKCTARLGKGSGQASSIFHMKKKKAGDRGGGGGGGGVVGV